MNARDRIYTGKVSEWGLPDGVVLTSQATGNDISITRLFEMTHNKYKIKSLPTDYKFNDAGEIVKEEAKRYWDGKEPIEVGMVVLYQGVETNIELPSDSNITYVVEDKRGEWAFVGCIDLKPVDTRTKKEKAIDVLMAEYKSDKDFIRMAFEFAYDKLVGSDE